MSTETVVKSETKAFVIMYACIQVINYDDGGVW